MKASHAKAKILWGIAAELEYALDNGHEWLYMEGSKYDVGHNKKDLRTIIRETKVLINSFRKRAEKLHPEPWSL